MDELVLSSFEVNRYEDTRPECRNVGSSIVTSLRYVDKFLQTRVALCMSDPSPGCRELVSYRCLYNFTDDVYC